ncbi:MAG TPA: hypothetical protein VFU73_08920, partial [Actinocrinis sp.]|nr:hypothetical protein [Actinocrinis sp.]
MELSASYRAPLPDSTMIGPADPAERIEVTVYLRRRQPLPPEVTSGRQRLTRDDLREQFGADPAEAGQVGAALSGHGLEVVETDLGARQ